VIYDLLFKASAETTLEIAATNRYLGARIGFMSVLHLMVRLTSFSACTRAGPLPRILLTFAASMTGRSSVQHNRWIDTNDANDRGNRRGDAHGDGEYEQLDHQIACDHDLHRAFRREMAMAVPINAAMANPMTALSNAWQIMTL
jgi:hypothetical protein